MLSDGFVSLCGHCLQLLPRRTNWEGRLCASQLQEIVRTFYFRLSVWVMTLYFRCIQASNCNVHSNTLPDILQKTIVLAEKARILKFNDLKSLIGSCLSSYPGGLLVMAFTVQLCI